MALELGLKGKTAILTGAGGAIVGTISKALAREAVKVAILDISKEKCEAVAEEIKCSGGEAIAIKCDVTDPTAVRQATKKTLEQFKTIDILVNGAGGAVKDATTSPELSFFDIELEAMERGFSLNYFSTFLTSQTVGKIFSEKGEGTILNISSIAGIEPITRAVAYSDAKAAVVSFTKWLSVYMTKNYSPKVRVNAIAPGFILTEQNRFLLIDEKKDKFTERGQKIKETVPMARLGEPDEIVGAALWLVSDSASFVTGAVIPVDGGYIAYGGV
jgi:NAD(P)-dependent dehydrogenase (short-subunit alcohol dehydrogenase family)